MKKLAFLLLFFAPLFFSCQDTSSSPDKQPIVEKRLPYSLAIHGGAGTITREAMTPEKEAAYRAALDSALTIGENILKNGGTSLDAVTQTIVFLEDCPLFNAGRGAVFTHEGKNELDASIMDGRNQMAGAVGGVTTVKNPIKLARAVMEKSTHVFLTGRGANSLPLKTASKPLRRNGFSRKNAGIRCRKFWLRKRQKKKPDLWIVTRILNSERSVAWRSTDKAISLPEPARAV